MEFFFKKIREMEIIKKDLGLIPKSYQNWQNRPEWFFNRQHTDTYEQWYEGRYTCRGLAKESNGTACYQRQAD